MRVEKAFTWSLINQFPAENIGFYANRSSSLMLFLRALDLVAKLLLEKLTNVRVFTCQVKNHDLNFVIIFLQFPMAAKLFLQALFGLDSIVVYLFLQP